jgi:hypothetical protein|nr:MAG TPA: hypothetical protein [Bacteriophage sp.]
MSRLTDARGELERYEQTKPADYQSKYQGQINDVMSKLNDLGEYDYDPAADTAYQQYKSQYAQKAKLANQNAQANASAMTGGYGSSYGTQAGQKAYAATMDDLNSVLDGLTAQNRAEYNTKKSGLQEQLSGLQSAEQNDYTKYQKDYSQWQDGLSYRQNEYNNAYSEQQQSTRNGLDILGGVLSFAAMILPFFL